jgi:S1-C subfamily serine protease
MYYYRSLFNRLQVSLLLLVSFCLVSIAASEDSVVCVSQARQYFLGEGVKQDYTKAAKLYKQAADTGNANGQNGYGVCLQNGFGVKKNESAAVRYFRLSAEQGFAAGCLNLADCLEGGIGIVRNEQEALKWAETAKRLTVKQSTEAEKTNFKYATSMIERLQVNQRKSAVGRITGFGTGFFITEDGYMLTCAHVVNAASMVKVCPPPVDPKGQMLTARVVKVDVKNDLALLKIDGHFKALALADADEVKLAQEVFTVGFPNVTVQGLAPKFTQGNISALSGIQDNPGLFQISVPVQPGNSGGPLANTRGNVVGVVSAQVNPAKLSRTPQNVNYAVKSIQAQALLQSVPGLADKLPKPLKSGSSMTKAAERVQGATALIVLME